MATVDYLPITKEITYYRGNTFILTDEFFETIDGEQVPMDLRNNAPLTYEAHVKYSPLQKKPPVIIPADYIVLGSTFINKEIIVDGSPTTEEVEVFNILDIDAPPSVFDNLGPVDEAYMDVFQYFFSGGIRKHRCLRRYNLNLINNVTNKKFD